MIHLSRRGVCLGMAAAGVAAPARADEPLSQKLDAVVRASPGFNGQVVVSEKGRVLLDAAYGVADPAARAPVTSRTRFQVASITKLFTAVTVMSLVDDGKLGLNSTVEEFFHKAPKDKKAITIAQLLSHTSGLPQDYAADGKRTRDAAVKAIFRSRLAFAPGQGFAYTNTGYALLAAIIEVAAREAYPGAVASRLFPKAGMSDVRFWDGVDPARDPDVARIVPGPLTQKLGVNWGQRGSGGIWCSARELQLFASALTGGRLISDRSFRELLEPRHELANDHAAYGWFVRKARPRLHWMRGNEDFGHNAALFWYPERDLIVTVTTNAGNDGDVAFARAIGARLEAALFT